MPRAISMPDYEKLVKDTLKDNPGVTDIKVLMSKIMQAGQGKLNPTTAETELYIRIHGVGMFYCPYIPDYL